MSLGIAIKGPEGIVLACDSRVTVVATQPAATVAVNFDNASKLFRFSEPHKFVAAVAYGGAVIGGRLLHSFIPEFEESQLADSSRLSVADYARQLQGFFTSQYEKAKDQGECTLLVGGYDEKAAYGKVFMVKVPGEGVIEQNPSDSNFGMTWGGQVEVASTLIHGYHPVLPGILRKRFNLKDEELQEFVTSLRPVMELRVPYQILPLQDCVDLAIFIIETTMSAQGLTLSQRGVGGFVEVATITRTEGLDYVQQRKIRGRRPH